MDKLQSIEELGRIAQRERFDGGQVVQAHGVFDLLHLGHVKHLRAARRQGTLLIVTVTADRHVNKGPDRPVFTAALRAEMLAALEIVDYVGISEFDSAENTIAAIKPNFYARGGEYLNFDDPTGNLARELKAVADNGGQTIFTNEPTLSSSNLINRHLDVQDPKVKAYLEPHRKNGTLDKLKDLIHEMSKLKVLVIGDTILDEYHYVTPMGKSPKENMIATLYKEREMFAGGVIAAANHVAGFCDHVDVVTAIGVDGHERTLNQALAKNAGLTCVVRMNMPTTKKSRFVDASYLRKLFEVYHMDDSPLRENEEETLIRCIREKAAQADLIIVTDFGHGLISDAVIDELYCGKFLAVNTQTNSANTGFNLATRYAPHYLCIDEPEARLATGYKNAPLEDVTRQLAYLAGSKIIVTHGRHGCLTHDRSVNADVIDIPAFTNTVVDTIGAGDAFLAVTSPLAYLGADIEQIGIVGNMVGALKVGIVGHRQPVTKVALLKYMEALLK